MGSPPSVDTGQVQEWFVGELADVANGGANTRTANGVYFAQIVCRSEQIVTGFRYQFGLGGTGTCQLGLYDEPGNLLAASAVTATATGVMTFALATPLPIMKGRYWHGFWISNVVDTSFSISATTAGALPAKTGTNAGGLPATIAATTGLTDFFRRMSIEVLVQGGWS